MCDKDVADGRERRKTRGTDLKTRAPHNVVGKKTIKLTASDLLFEDGVDHEVDKMCTGLWRELDVTEKS